MSRIDKGAALALAAAIMWTAPSILTRILLETLSPAQIVFLRTAAGSVAFLLILLAMRRRLPSFSKKDLPAIILLAAFFFPILYMFAIAVDLTTIANAQFLNQTDTIFTFLFAHFLLREYATRRLYMALALELGGIALIFYGEFALAGPESLAGPLAALLSGVSFSIYTIASRRFFNSVSMESMLGVFFLSTVFAGAASIGPFPEISTYFWLLLVLLGLFTVVPYFLFTYSMKYTQPQRPAIIGKLTVVTAPAAAFFIFGEMPSAFSAAGGALILLGSVIAILEKPKEPI